MFEKQTMKQDKKFKPLPVEKGDELFPNGIFEFNISKLVAFIKENPDGFSFESVAVKALPAWASTHLNESTIEAADLSVPNILAEISPGMFNVIDGNHRLEKARRNGADTIPAYRVYARQHTAFLPSVDAYYLYIDYWNSKIPKEVRIRSKKKS